METDPCAQPPPISQQDKDALLLCFSLSEDPIAAAQKSGLHYADILASSSRPEIAAYVEQHSGIHTRLRRDGAAALRSVMAGRPFSKWDYYSLRWAGTDATLEKQLQRRTAGFDRFDSLSAQERARLQADYDDRRRYWQRKVSPRGDRPVRIGTDMITVMFVLSVVAGLLAVGFPPFGPWWWTTPMWFRLLSLLTIAALVALIIRYSLRVWWERHAVRRSLASGSCPDCGYDVRGAPAAIDPAEFPHPIGPARCPECGSPWPLLPPPVPDPTFARGSK